MGKIHDAFIKAKSWRKGDLWEGKAVKMCDGDRGDYIYTRDHGFLLTPDKVIYSCKHCGKMRRGDGSTESGKEWCKCKNWEPDSY